MAERAVQILGKGTPILKGNYISSSTYQRLNTVYHNNATYYAKKNVPINMPPPNATYWQVTIDAGPAITNANTATTQANTARDGANAAAAAAREVIADVAAAALDVAASRWSFFADGNPITIHPTSGSAMRITGTANGTLTVNGATQAITANTPVNVTAIAGENVLSVSAGTLKIGYNRDSMDLLEQLAAPAEATGPAARLSGLIDDLPLDVTVRIVAAQAGTGDSSPDNIRAFTPKTQVQTSRAGSNLVDIANYTHTKPDTRTRRVTLPGMAPGTYTLSMTLSDAGGSISAFAVRPEISANTITGASDVQITPAVNGRVSIQVSSPKVFNNLYFYIPSTAPDGATVTVSDICMDPGNAGIMPYAPYQGSSQIITLPEAVYGLIDKPNTLDLRAGVLTVNDRLYSFTGSEAVTNTSGVPGAGYCAVTVHTGTGGSIAPRGLIQSSHLMYAPRNNIVAGVTQEKPWVNDQGAWGMIIALSRLTPHGATIDRATHPAAVKAWLAAQVTAGTPVQVLLELPTPRTLTVDPTTILAPDGTISVWTNAGGDTTLAGLLSASGAYNLIDARLRALEVTP